VVAHIILPVLFQGILYKDIIKIHVVGKDIIKINKKTCSLIRVSARWNCRIDRMKKNSEHTTAGTPEATAALRYIKGTASVEEETAVNKWLAEDESHEKELQQIARIYYARQTKERILARDSSKAFDRVKKQIKRKTQIMWMRGIAIAAACLTSVLLLSTALSYYYMKQTAEPVPQTVTITSNPGMRTQFGLPDGTIVHLNSGSTFTYPVPYNKEERRVTLSGEAYFNVAHKEDHPFIVNVLNGNLNVKVTGTEFNIQAYENDEEINTTLLSGSVVLEYTGRKGNTDRILLAPSEKVTYNPSTKHFNKTEVNTQIETSWIEGKIIFRNTPIPEVLKRLSHYYNVRFDIKNPEIERYHFTGTFINKQLSQVLDYLKISSDINYKINSTMEDDSSGMKYSTIVLWKNK
jgi:ferric-dicitrate binding protein FerR (iron transport regulator)